MTSTTTAGMRTDTNALTPEVSRSVTPPSPTDEGAPLASDRGEDPTAAAAAATATASAAAASAPWALGLPSSVEGFFEESASAFVCSAVVGTGTSTLLTAGGGFDAAAAASSCSVRGYRQEFGTQKGAVAAALPVCLRAHLSRRAQLFKLKKKSTVLLIVTLTLFPVRVLLFLFLAIFTARFFANSSFFSKEAASLAAFSLRSSSSRSFSVLLLLRPFAALLPVTS